MKWLITGGFSGLGEAMVRKDPENRSSLSRRNGFDISLPAGREKIAQESLKYDIFVNNASDGPPHKDWADWGQCKLLIEVVDLWNEKKHRGKIINIGSYGSISELHDFTEFEWYRVPKIALDFLSMHYAREFFANRSIVPSTLIRPGRLDTAKSRSRSTWTGNGLNLDYLVQLIELSTTINSNSCLEKLDINVNLDFNQ